MAPKRKLVQQTLSTAKLSKSDPVSYLPTNKPQPSPAFLQHLHSARSAAAKDVTHFPFNEKRVQWLISPTAKGERDRPSGGVACWLMRDRRVQDNWALLYAQKLACQANAPLHVVVAMAPTFKHSSRRHYEFMIAGFEEMHKELNELDIPFHMELGTGAQTIPELCKRLKINTVVCDMSPIRPPVTWVQELKEALPSGIALARVDAHNVVPVWEASDKQETAARTFRPKVTGKLKEFLTEFPPLVQHTPNKDLSESEKSSPIDWHKVRSFPKVDESVKQVSWLTPGTKGGLAMLESFIQERLKRFADDRNDPVILPASTSFLSPYQHFGHVAPQRISLMVKECSGKHSASVASFLEEQIVRRELSDNFCWYNPQYDSLKGAAQWAQDTLRNHEKDKREYVYSREQFEKAKTHDQLWNAAQKQLVIEGRLQGFMRMYWAKKILEWSDSPADALDTGFYLNDKFALDGSDPNGYVGVMWSIVGIHDMGWTERPIFGKIRFMNYNGCKRKFNVPAFEMRYSHSLD